MPAESLSAGGQTARHWNVQAIQVEVNGMTEHYYLTAIERELDAFQLRGEAVSSFTPIHSYMFGLTGQLLYSTTTASQKIKARGGPVLPC